MVYKSAFSLFSLSKDAVMRNPVPFLVLTFLPGFLLAVADAMNGNPSWPPFNSNGAANPTANSLLFYMFGGLASVLTITAGFYLELKAAKGDSPTTSEAFNSSLRYFWRTMGLMMLISIIIILGLFALIIPGIVFIKWFFLAPYFLVGQDMGIKEAMKASKAASKGNGNAIFAVVGVMALLSLFSLIPIFGGFISLVLVTLYACAPALRFYEITGKKLKSTA